MRDCVHARVVNSDSSLLERPPISAISLRPVSGLEPDVFERAIQNLWGETALVGGVLRAPQPGLRVARVGSRADGAWRLAYTQLTRMPDN